MAKRGRPRKGQDLRPRKYDMRGVQLCRERVVLIRYHDMIRAPAYDLTAANPRHAALHLVARFGKEPDAPVTILHRGQEIGRSTLARLAAGLPLEPPPPSDLQKADLGNRRVGA